MPTAEKVTSVTPETWLDWLRYTKDALTRGDFIEEINREYGSNLSAEQLQSWEDRGLLPLPIQGIGYPYNAGLIVRALQDFERNANDTPPESIRAMLRGVARSIDADAYLEALDLLAEIQQEAEAGQQTWVDWMPEDSPDPGVLSRDELLEALHERGVAITKYTLDHYRRNGILPRPVRRRHGGVTQAVYPSWYIGAIAHLKQLQNAGKSLEDIKPWIRTWALSTVRWGDPLDEPITRAQAALQAVADAVHDPRITGVRVSFVDDAGDERFRHEGRLAGL